MAKFNPPINFSFDKPSEWPDWKQRFVRYRTATKLDKEDGAVQVSCLIYAMGSESENVYRSFTFEEEGHSNDFDRVLGKFDEYFVPRRNVIHERACFHQRVQRPGEKAETFIRALYELSEHCDFGASRDENIRDRIVVGILDKDVSRRLQLIKDLTLALTIETVRQSEEVASQVSMQGEAAGVIHEITHKQRSKYTKLYGKPKGGKDGLCGKCGRERHSKDENCPARKSKCNACSKIGHWARVCRNRKAVSEVTEQAEQSYFLGAVSKAEGSSEQWTVKLLVGSTPVDFKIDTGADVSIISEETYHSLFPKRPLETAKIPLDSPGGELECIGQVQSTVTYKGETHPLTAYVIRGRTVSNLLSRPLSVKMNLVKRVNELVCSKGHSQAFGEHGTLKTEPVRIQLKDNAKPFAVHTARRVPFPLLQKVKEELQRMERNGIIERVTQPTDWCAPMVPVLKKSTGKVRICVDLKKLNEAVKREQYLLPTTEEITAKLSGATVFSSLDAASGFFQIPLHPDSCKLTTFITPFGRFSFKRLPFGITSAPEIFQRKMKETLQGLEGVEVFMDDILIHAATMEEHDRRLEMVMQRIETAGMKLNREKCSIRQNELRFLGHLIDQSGIRPDPDKVKAIQQLPPPADVQELKRILGMVNYLGRYIPNLSTVGQPLYELLKRNKNTWTWDHAQQTAFENIKELLTTAPVLAYYDVNKPTAVSADASSYGLGGVLLQLHGEQWKPVAFCSRRLSEAETRYAQIEKESLAGVWACEKFDRYLTGLEQFKLVTDHKPLVPLINNRSLDNVPLRCQRLLMRLMRFNPIAEYAPGKTLIIADTLSRSPLACSDVDTHSDVACYVASVVGGIPASPSKMDEIRTATSIDAELASVIKLIRTGWPEHLSSVPEAAREYIQVKSELSEYNGLVLRGSRIVVPRAMRGEILLKIHDGHQGLVKCRERANSSVWWPRLSKELSELVTSCQVCRELKRTQQKEPLICTKLPERPWQRIAMDLCEYKHQQYLVISDYYSRFLEILHLPTTTSAQVIKKLKTVFARFGIPDEVVSDNGPQFSCAEFQEFARQLDFKHCTSSPHYPQGNGHAERAVQTAKKILKQEDPVLALMCYRSTPCSSTGFSPAELLMGRKIRTTLPTLEKNLLPKWPSRTAVKVKDGQEKAKQAYYFNRRHGAKPLPALRPGDAVFLKLDNEKSWSLPAVVSSESTTPRSFVVRTHHGTELRRNRRHLQLGPVHHPAADHNTGTDQSDVPTIETVPASQNLDKPTSPLPTLTVTRSGRVCKPVSRLDL
uniref:Gypsy retrotransposon integrase-like protein 1 n=1 Tax=Astyanax mexicanus TaxID=7994 RepID=A0A3B1ITQ0_ASTMX